jgi:aldehyde:ferredoxin oxidoreductase
MPADLGDVLDVDLSLGHCERRPYDEDVAGLLLAGHGFCSHELWRAAEAGVEPSAPENPLVLSCGVLAASAAPCSCRTMISARSPLTGLGGHSNVGGRFAAHLRRAGLQGIVVHGMAASPVALRIHANGQELIDAQALWGLDTPEAMAVLTAESGWKDKRPSVLLIGRGGENRVRFAAIVSPESHAAGRTGMGAVMGAKKLKAIVIDRESGDIPTLPSARTAARHYVRMIVDAPGYSFWARFGSGTVKEASDLGMLTTRDFEKSTFEHADAMDTSSLDRSVVKRRGCPGCPIRCKADMVLRSGAYAGERADRPEFESLCMWGPRLGVGDGDAVVHLAKLCDSLGVDTDSTAAVVAFAIDLFERRLIDTNDTDGLRLAWGDVESIERLVVRTALRQGFGDVLADGVRAAASRIGRGSEKFAYHVKGLEIPCYDPRSSSATALAYAVMNRGADYASAYVRHEDDCAPEKAVRLYGDVAATDRNVRTGKASMVWRGVVVSAALDALGLCKFPVLSLLNEYDLVNEAELATAILGTPIDAEALLEVGHRIATLDRLINVRFGATANDDSLPALFVETPLRDGPGAGNTAQVADSLQEYYKLMGWSADGVPTEESLQRLSLGRLIGSS